MPWTIRKRENEYCVYKKDADGNPTGEALGCHPSRAKAQKQIAALEANVNEMLRDYRVAEFRGNFPQIATAESVQLDALTQGDDDPFFVTLPIAEIGATSSNGLHYDEALVKAIQTQMVGKGGLMGHISDADRDTAFPIEAADWIGALLQGATLWGKAYIPPGEAREYIRRLKARGGKLATSIYGPYGESEKRDDGSWIIMSDGFTLESLDLAPADRAALSLGGDFNVTAQMDSQEDNEMTKEEILAQLTLEDVPEKLRASIIKAYQETTDAAAEMAKLEAERDAAQKLVKEQQEQLAQRDAAQFEAALDKTVAEIVAWNVEGDDNKKRVAMVRDALKRQVLSEMADDRDTAKIEEIAKAAWKGEEMQLLAETVKTALGGPRAIVGNHRRDFSKLEDTPEARAEARRKTGI